MKISLFAGVSRAKLAGETPALQFTISSTDCYSQVIGVHFCQLLNFLALHAPFDNGALHVVNLLRI